MKSIIRPLVILCMAAVLTASCLGDDDNSDITYYGDTAITAFSLGTLNRYVTTKASSTFDDEGNPVDSTYKTTVTGSSYKFYIDQLNGRIYNTDSLPIGTDTTRVVCSVTSKNSGLVVINYANAEGADSLVYYNSSDSVDFSKTKDFRVYCTEGTAFRKYTVNVNVHKEEADSFTWNAPVSVEALKSIKGMRAVYHNEKMMVFGSDGTQTHVYTLSLNGVGALNEITTNITLDAEAYSNVITDGDKLYTLSNGTLMFSADGANWLDAMSINSVADDCVALSDLKRLIGSNSKYVYALTADGIAYAEPSMIWFWTKDGNLNDDAAWLPSREVTSGVFALKTNSDSERIIMVGNRDASAYQTDTTAVVWSKIEEYKSGSDTHKWILCNEENKMQLPRLTGLTAVKYGNALVALGGEGLGSCATAGFKKLYVSLDNGLTWQGDSSYPLPSDFTNGGSNVFAMAVDDANFLWIISGGEGKVWRGRLNKLGWTTDKTSFTK